MNLRRLAAGSALCLVTVSVEGQGNSLLTSLRAGGVAEATGPIPVFYVEGEKERALGFQKSLQAGVDWYDKQLGVTVSFAMTVFDSATYEKFKLAPIGAGGGASRPPLGDDPPILMMPVRTPGATNPLQGEAVLFHEYGHILARRLGIGGVVNGQVEELVANIIMSSYVRSERPDLFAVWERLRAATGAPRYTALVDYDYLGAGIDSASAQWLQYQMIGIAFALTENQRLSDLVPKLRQEFPLSTARRDGGADLAARLARISTGFRASSWASALGPTTVTPATPVACEAAAPAGADMGRLTIVNATANPITMTFTLTDGRDASGTIPPNEFRTLSNTVGVLVRIVGRSCYVIRENPTAATIVDH